MRLICVVGLTLAMIASPTRAKEKSAPAYLGAWVITESIPAPWIKSDAELFDNERVALVGKRIVFGRRNIDAPSPLGCNGPHYKIRHYATGMLFQGTLTKPASQAAALGFSGSTIITLETGCEGPLDYHFIDGRTAMFALNNAIYTVKRAD